MFILSCIERKVLKMYGSVNNKYNPYLFEVFSAKIINELIARGHSDFFTNTLIDSGFSSYISRGNTHWVPLLC